MDRRIKVKALVTKGTMLVVANECGLFKCEPLTSWTNTSPQLESIQDACKVYGERHNNRILVLKVVGYYDPPQQVEGTYTEVKDDEG